MPEGASDLGKGAGGLPNLESMHRLRNLPSSVRHVVVVTTVPVIFPNLPLSEFVLKSLNNLEFIKGAMQKTGLAKGLFDS